MIPSSKVRETVEQRDAHRDVAIGVMAYNEEDNIENLLRSLLRQTALPRISRIVVIASGCTDSTPQIVERLAAEDARIHLVCERERSGKIAAINTFLAMTSEPLLVVSCGDLIFAAETLQELLSPFEDPTVGMTGARPIPTNDESTFTGFAVATMWRMHDSISREKPKMGELVAFRNVLPALDVHALCDELSIEHMIRSADFKVAYALRATVSNQGPKTVREFFVQRCRWIAANYQVMSDYNLPVATMQKRRLLRAAIKDVLTSVPRPDWLAAVVAIEIAARTKAFWDYHIIRSRQKYRVWRPLRSTKNLHEGRRESDSVQDPRVRTSA